MMNSNMDLNTIKNIICVMRDKGMTYQAISDKLRDDYGIVKSRQAIQGLYVRAREDRANKLSESELSLKCDTISIYNLGYNMTQVTKILQSNYPDITYQKVLSIIKENKEYSHNMEIASIALLQDSFDNEDDPNVLKNMLTYKGVPVTQNRFNYLISQVVAGRIKEYSTSQISRMYKLTGSKTDAKDICNLINIVSFNNIENNIKDMK